MNPAPQPVRVLSTLAVQGVIEELAPRLRAEAALDPAFVFEPTALLLARLRAGEPADVAILTAGGVDALARDDVLDRDTSVDVAVSQVGIAVRQGAPRPDISTPHAVRDLLRATPSLCYSRAGASGIFFAKVIAQLGLTEEVAAKAVVIPSGFTAVHVASGRCEIAIQQLSELMMVPGIEIVGPLPDPIQERLTFRAAISAHARHPAAAARFLAHLTDASLATLYRRHGLSQPAA